MIINDNMNSVNAVYEITDSSTTISVDWESIMSARANPELDGLSTRIGEIEERLSILRPDEILQEKYPALKEAYDAYQVILKLVKDNAKTKG